MKKDPADKYVWQFLKDFLKPSIGLSTAGIFREKTEHALFSILSPPGSVHTKEHDLGNTGLSILIPVKIQRYVHTISIPVTVIVPRKIRA